SGRRHQATTGTPSTFPSSRGCCAPSRPCRPRPSCPQPGSADPRAERGPVRDGGDITDRAALAAAAICSLVPAVRLLVRPGAARRAVVALNIGQAPADLGAGVGLPVAAGARHLRPGQRLRDAVGARTRVLSVRVPAALVGPKRLEAGELAARP